MQRTTPLRLGLAATALAAAGLLGAGAGAALTDEPSTPAPVTSAAAPVTFAAADATQPDGDGSDSDTRQHMRQMTRMHELCNSMMGQTMSGQGGMGG